jgi:peptidyl-prolyl cis-trans isomerase A (cyclophilin A)
MKNRDTVSRIIGLILLLASSMTAVAEEVVRVNITSDAVNYDVDITLFDELAPLNTANFLNYVDSSRYDKSFIHRSVSNFIMQSGGFTFDSNVGQFVYDKVNDQFNGGLQPVLTDPPVPNEFKLSSIRGTVAMAKVAPQYKDSIGNTCYIEGPDCILVDGTGPDSATSQWFVNLEDNSNNLNSQNEGFTVFGKVVSNGMDVIDILRLSEIWNIYATHLDFNELPLNNTDSLISQTSISENNLIMFNSFTRLFHIDTIVNFNPPTGSPETKNFSITNNSVIPVVIGMIDISDIGSEFSVDKSICENKTLAISESCTIQATLTPGSDLYYSANIKVDVTNINHVFNINLTTPAPNLSSSLKIIDYGDQQKYNPATSTPTKEIKLFINNIGDQDLEISSVVSTGETPTAFPYVEDCTSASPLPPGKFCKVTINFAPEITGIINAEMVITSNDPDTPELVIPLTGISNDDLDGVSASIEDLSPNNGDGNNDGVKDRDQSQVFSIPDSINRYNTIITDSSHILDAVSVTSLSSLPLPAENTNLEGGLLKFRLSKLNAGALSSIGVILPADTSAIDVHGFGPTPDDASPHWYSLSANVDIFNNSKITSVEGTTISRNLVRLYVQDGGVGDSDLIVNGEILMRIAIDTKPSGSTDSSMGSTCQYLLLMLFLIVLAGRSIPRVYIKL